MRGVLGVIVLVAMPFTAVACGSDSSSSTSAAAVTTTATTAAAAAKCIQPGQGDPVEGYVGLTQAEAEKLAASTGLTLRVVGVDGVCQVITMDLRTDRVNVELVDGKVVAASKF